MSAGNSISELSSHVQIFIVVNPRHKSTQQVYQIVRRILISDRHKKTLPAREPHLSLDHVPPAVPVSVRDHALTP